MTIRFGKELYTTSLVQLLQFLNDLRGVHLKLLNTCSRQ